MKSDAKQYQKWHCLIKVKIRLLPNQQLSPKHVFSLISVNVFMQVRICEIRPYVLNMQGDGSLLLFKP